MINFDSFKETDTLTVLIPLSKNQYARIDTLNRYWNYNDLVDLKMRCTILSKSKKDSSLFTEMKVVPFYLNRNDVKYYKQMEGSPFIDDTILNIKPYDTIELYSWLPWIFKKDDK